MEYLGAGWSVVNFPNVDKEITTLAVNINLNSYMGDTADKVSCVKNVYNRKIRPFTMCHASNSKFYLI